MNARPTSEPPPDRDASARAVASLPSLLLALGGACLLSVLIAFGMALAGHGPPPLPVLAAPPVLVLVVFAVRLLRRSGTSAP